MFLRAENVVLFLICYAALHDEVGMPNCEVALNLAYGAASLRFKYSNAINEYA